MILALLLQIGLAGFQSQVKEAAWRMGVSPTPPVFMMAVNYETARRLAWSDICTVTPCPTASVCIAVDVASIAPAPVLRYLAYHEVCHVKLGHTAMGMDWSPAMDQQVAYCMQQALGSTQAYQLKWQRDNFAEYTLRSMRRSQFGADSLR